MNIIDVSVLNNPGTFTSPFQFEVTFECIQELQDDLEWKVVYVGNAEDNSGDQVLEEVMVGPVAMGINRFVLQADPPNPAMISNSDLIGVTVILISCAYMDHKFVQIGYYVNNEYAEPFDPEAYPNPVDVNKLIRNTIAGEPRVTQFAIDWTGGSCPLVAEPAGSNEGEGQDNGAAEGGGGDDGDVIDLDNQQDDEEDEEDDGDDDGEVDLENEDDDDDEDDEMGEDGEVDEDGDGEGEVEEQEQSMEMLNEDSMDVARMLQ